MSRWSSLTAAVAPTLLIVGCASVGAPAPSGSLPAPPPSVSPSTPTPSANVVHIVRGEGALAAPVPTLDRLASDTRTRAIVFGRVSATKDFCWEGAGYRLLTIDVTSAAKGTSTNSVRVVEDGGIVDGTCLAGVVENKFDERVSIGPNDLVDYQIEGHDHTTVGNQVVAFLDAESLDTFGATHRLVTGIQGLLVRRGDHYVRSVLDTPQDRAAGIESSTPAAELENRLRTAARG